MTAPTGESANYEQTEAELVALAETQRQHVDLCQATLTNVQAAKASVDSMQQSYRESSAAAQTMNDGLAAKHLDGVTLGHTGTVADAMPAGEVDTLFAHLEVVEAKAQERLNAAEVALSSTEAALAHLRATYGDAHATVAGNLSGDSSFLDSGAGWSPAPAQVNGHHYSQPEQAKPAGKVAA